MSKSVFLLPVLLTLVFPPLIAQDAELPPRHIPVVTVVKSNRDFFSDDHPVIHLDRGSLMTRQESLGTLLERESPVLVRSYGAAGSLMSISLRGTGSNHTQVNWNGFPLNSPTTGQADLSLVPALFMQTVGIIQGASGALFGSGTFGGSVNIGNAADWENRVSLVYQADAGSFGTFGNALTLATGSSRFQYHLSVSTARSRNDFTYRDSYRYGDPQLRSSHNGYLSRGIIQNAYADLGKGNYLEGGIWIQQKVKEMPALMGYYNESNAVQRDSLLRSYVTYRKSADKSVFVVRSAWFSDNLRYMDKHNRTDSNYAVDSRITARRWMNSADYRYYFSPVWVAGGGVSYNLTDGISRNYGGAIREHEVALYGNLKVKLEKWVFNAGLRKEFHNDINPPLQYALGMRYRAGDRLVFRTEVSSKFRKPTFNEKYWTPGGNPRLHPEKGWGGEISGEWALKPRSEHGFQLDAMVTLYDQHIDNWIQWVARDSLTPVEYKKVHASGAEARLQVDLEGERFGLNGFAGYNFTHSVITGTYDDNPLFVGQQMIYVPRHAIKTGVTARYAGLRLSVSSTYSGRRETVETGDPLYRLEPFALLDLMLDYTFRFHDWEIGAGARLNNVLNTRYQVIRSYPMPGRFVMFSLQVRFDADGTSR